MSFQRGASLRLDYQDFADRIDVDAVEEAIGFEPIEQRDGNDVGYCPLPWGLHKNGDTTGKFGIHRNKRVFNCWVCGGGSLLSLAMAVRDLQEQDATDWLYQFTTPADQTDEDFQDEIEALLAQHQRQQAVLPYFNENVLTAWETDHPWFAERGISPGIRKEFRLGYNPNAVKRSRKGDYEGPAIVLPHFWGGRLVGWQHRWLDDTPKHIPKYVNTSDFPRKETIFNYERVYLSPSPIVVVESVSTALFLTSLGLACVATFGASVSDEQRQLLRRCQQGIILAHDNDPPGHKWVESNDEPLLDYLERYIKVKVCEPVGEYPDGDDLGDLVSDPDQVWERIASAESH